MQYCPSCGAPAEGRFCAKCGAALPVADPMSGPAAPGPSSAPPPYTGAPYVPPGATSIGMDENIAAALCYIPIVGLIFLLLEPYKGNRTLRFHAFQSLFYLAAYIVLRICLGILGGVLTAAMPFSFYALWALVMSLVGLAYLAGLILLAVKAYQRSPLILPVVGPMAERAAGGALL